MSTEDAATTAPGTTGLEPLGRAAAGAPAVLVAMDEEAQPFLDAAEILAGPVDLGRARYWALRTRSRDDGRDEAGEGAPMLLVRTGIGLVNAASAATTAIALTRPVALFSAGSAGGLRADTEVGDLAVGTEYAFTDADATAFGYVRGQLPGLPETFPADSALLAAARDLVPMEGTAHRVGPMLAGNSFVMAHNVEDAREVFPEAVSTDMETTAIAQVADACSVPFLSVRGISDLCGPAADQDFHLAVEIVAERSARAVTALARHAGRASD